MDFYSIAEAAQMSAQSQKTVRRHIAAGKLKADKVGNCYRITKENYNKWLISDLDPEKSVEYIELLMNEAPQDIDYNVYNTASNQTDPAGKTIKLYGHNYKTFNDIKNIQHGNVPLTLLSTVKVPNTLGSSSIDFLLTDNEIAKLKKCKGLMFMTEDKNELTVHGAKCSITITYK